MRFSALALSVFVLSASTSLAQNQFSTQTYPSVLPPSSDHNRLLSADLHGDGQADLVAFGSRSSSSTVPGNVFYNNGSGGFLDPVPLPGTGMLNDAKIADMNGDHYPDIVACQNVGSASTLAVSVIVYLNNGNGTFRALPAVTAPGQCGGMAVGELYQGGPTDVVTAGHTPGTYSASGTFTPGNTNYLDVFSNDGTGKLSLVQSTSPYTDDPSVSSNFTNCGLIDVVGGDFIQNSQFDILLTSQCQPPGQTSSSNYGTTYFAAETPSGSSEGVYAQPYPVNTADQIYTQGQAATPNAYSSPDAFFIASGKSVVEARANGGGTFQFNYFYTDSEVDGSYLADFNGDGFNDLAVTHDPNTSSAGPAGPPILTILQGTQNANFVYPQDFTIGTSTQIGGGVVAADFNGDGKTDIATLVYDINTRATSLVILTNTLGSSSTGCVDTNSTTPNVICSPATGTTVSSPLTVKGASNVPNFTLNRLYLDNQQVYQVASQTVDTPITAGEGSHRLVLVTYDSQGHAYTSAATFIVDSDDTCSRSSAGVTICAPAANSSDTSPVEINAAAMAANGNLTAVRAYIDNVAVFTVNSPSATKTFSVSRSVTVAPGTHQLVVLGYQSTGGQVSSSDSFSVSGAPCYPSSAGALICSPKAGSTTSSPVSVVGGVTTSSGYVAAIRVYVDNVARALVNNPQQTKSFQVQQSVTAAAGSHSLVIVGYPSTGGAISSRETFTVE